VLFVGAMGRIGAGVWALIDSKRKIKGDAESRQGGTGLQSKMGAQLGDPHV